MQNLVLQHLLVKEDLQLVLEAKKMMMRFKIEFAGFCANFLAICFYEKDTSIDDWSKTKSFRKGRDIYKPFWRKKNWSMQNLVLQHVLVKENLKLVFEATKMMLSFKIEFSGFCANSLAFCFNVKRYFNRWLIGNKLVSEGPWNL